MKSKAALESGEMHFREERKWHLRCDRLTEGEASSPRPMNPIGQRQSSRGISEANLMYGA